MIQGFCRKPIFARLLHGAECEEPLLGAWQIQRNTSSESIRTHLHFHRISHAHLWRLGVQQSHKRSHRVKRCQHVQEEISLDLNLERKQLYSNRWSFHSTLIWESRFERANEEEGVIQPARCKPRVMAAKNN